MRLTPSHRCGVFASIALVWVSGALWLVFHYFMQAAGSFGPRPHVLEFWWLRLHGLAAMFVLIAFGSLFTVHIGRAWRLRRNRGMGVGLTIGFGWLTVTGYALYYFATEDNAHWLPGVMPPVLLLMHLRTGRRVTKSNSGIAPNS